jgi:hypothetical protein
VDRQLQFWASDALEIPTNQREPIRKSSNVVDDERSQCVTPKTPPQLITSGVIACECQVPLHRVRWILDTRHDIKPAAYAGILRLYTPAAVARVRHELNAIDARRANRGGDS